MRTVLSVLLVAASAAAEVEPTMKPDYSKLQYKGDMVCGHRQDSFALAVQAAAKLFGRETDYEAITAMAGNAFAPFRNLEENCTSHCQLEAVYSDRAMTTVAGFVGLQARKLELPAFEGFGVKDADRSAYLMAVAKAVREAMDAGEVVLVLQGWEVKGGPHGFTHWGYAGIVTEADPATGRILGAHLNGHKDNPIRHSSVMWAVAPGEVTLKSPEAEQTMLRQAVDCIRGRGLFAPKDPVVYGLAAMDAWITHMQTVKGYCAPCWGRGQKSWHDAMENGERLLRGARVAAKKLRAIGPQYEAAAKHYDRIVELLAPVKYQDFIGDLDKQNAHAETVLKPVRAELAAAADEIEKTMPAADPSRCVLEGVPKVGFDVHTCPLPTCVEALTKYLKEPVTYDYLMGVSGAAFRLLWNRDDGGNVDLMYFAPEPADRIFRAIGYEYTHLRPEDRQKTLDAIKESLRRGVPAISFGILGPPEAGLICGYSKGGEALLGYSFFDFKPHPPPGYYEETGWFEQMRNCVAADDHPSLSGVIVLGKKTAPAPARETLIRSLDWAIALARTPKRPNLPGHVLGLAAYEAWAAALEVDADYPADDKKTMGTRAMVHGDAARMLEERQSAAAFLRGMVGVAPAADDDLRAAADLYEQIGREPAVFPWGGFRHGSDAAKVGLPDAATRRGIAKTLRALREKEAKAVEHLEAAREKLRGGAPDAMELKLADGQRRKWIEGSTAPGGLRPLVQFMGAEGGFAAEGDWYSTEIFPLFMGVCGDAFRFIWYRQDGAKWQRGDEHAVSPPNTRYLAALDAAGFEAQLAFDPRLTGIPSSLPWDAATLRREIVASIAERKWPVLLADLPEPGWNAVITGYERNGEVLVGWCEEGWESFGFRFDPARKRKFEDWFAKVGGAVLLTEKHARPAEADVLRAALARAVPELRRRAAGPLHAGPATYELLAQRLNDAALSAGDEATARRRNELLHPPVWDLATQRHYAAGFLKRAAEVFAPAKDQLEAAAGLFQSIHDAVWEINRIGGGKDPGSPLPRTIDPAVRKQIADILLKCRERDLEAAAKIEEALAKVPPPERSELKPSPLIQEVPGTRPQIECPPGPGVLRALMEFVGEDFGYSTNRSHNIVWRSNECFPLFMALYGDSFRFIWLLHSGQQAGEAQMCSQDDHPQRFLACLDAAGFSAQAAVKPGLSSLPPPFAWDEPTLRRAIVASIAERKWPVMLMGLPQRGRAGIITGYEKNGEVLTGWCVEGGDDRGIRFEPAKRQTFTNWFPKVTQIVLLTGRRVRTPAAVVYRTTLERAVTEMRATEFGACHAGPATFDAWAKQLEDPMLSKDDPETLRRCGGILDPMIWDLATRRHYGNLFMRRAARLFPASADELNAAGDLFCGIHDAMWEINRLGGAKWPGQPLPKLVDPAVRKQIAEIILKCRDRDLEAAGKIEAALRKKGNPKVVAANTVRLDGMKARRSYVSQVSCLKVCLDYLGADVSMAWLCGGTGQAFFVNVHGDVDCAGPTGWNEEPVRELAANLGARVTTGVFVSKKDAGPDYPAWQRKAYDFVRGRIDRGIPCYGYEVWPWIPDWQAICGYDDVGYHCLSGMGPGGPNPWQDLGDRDIKKIQVFSVERCTPVDDTKIVHDACAAALSHAAGVSRYGTAITGPAAFEHWAQKLGNGEAERDAGAYNGAYYHECRALAVEFLQEAKRRLPGRCDAAFDEAIAQYTVVRDQLAAFLKICPERRNADWKARFQSKEGAEVMRTAAAAERRGLEALKTIAAALGKSP